MSGFGEVASLAGMARKKKSPGGGPSTFSMSGPPPPPGIMSIPQFLSISLQDPVLSFETEQDQPQLLPSSKHEATTNTSGVYEPPHQI